MSDLLTFPVGGILERGDQVELAMRLIEFDQRRTGERPVTDEAGTYHVWDAKIGLWVAMNADVIKCRVDAFAGAPVGGKKGDYPLKVKAGDGAAVAEVMRRNTLRLGFFRDDVIAFQNGRVLRVADDEVLDEQATPAHGVRVQVPVDYQDDWELPRDSLLAGYLDSTFSHQSQRLRIVEVMGAALMGLGTRYKKAWWLADGPEINSRGGTGKSQILKILQGLVPEERRTSCTPQDMCDKVEGAVLYGKTLNLVFETPKMDVMREAGFKAIVHGEEIKRTPKYANPIVFEPLALHVFATNQLPQAPGATGAFWDRQEIIEFNQRFRDTSIEVPHLAERVLKDELEHVIHLAVRGACRLLSSKGYTPSEESADALARWRVSAEPVAVWLDECCTVVEDANAQRWSKGRELFGAYIDWTRMVRYGDMSEKSFCKRLEAFVEKKISNGARYRTRLLTRAEIATRDGDDDMWDKF